MQLTARPAACQEIQDAISGTVKVIEFVVIRQNEEQISTEASSLVPGLLLDLAIEHCIGIVHLIQGQIYSPAFALLRVANEALIRGSWLQVCGTQEECINFLDSDRLPLNYGDMVDAIELHSDFSNKYFSDLKRTSWKAMNGYTHGGIHQVARRTDGTVIDQYFEAKEVVEVLRAASFFALVALRQISRLSVNDTLARDIDLRLKPNG